jgi:DNA-binding transcriptional MerR regulator
MKDGLDIAEVVRRTGLSSRTLRFYEARGLVTPLRAHNGRRLYGRAELERINQIVALKRAGLTLARIQRAMAEREIDLCGLIDGQIQALNARKQEIDRALMLLYQALGSIEPDRPVGLDALCALIRRGAEALDDGPARMRALFAGVDIDGIRDKWVDLMRRIEAAMPIDPASAEAQALYDEVEPLFAPFFAWWKERGATVAPGAGGMPAGMAQWSGWPHFSAKAWQFLFAVRRRRDAGTG